MRIIKWSSKKFGQLDILVDDEDYDRLIKYPWGVLKCVSSDVLYVKARNVDPERPRKYFSLHRFILGIDDPKIFVDHKNGNGLDNRKENLRKSTNRDNCRNRGKQKNNTSGFKGVVAIKGTNSFKAILSIRNGQTRKTVLCKQFKSAVEAAKVWNEAALKYHGEFAYQNPV
jgi:hypothetical protein